MGLPQFRFTLKHKGESSLDFTNNSFDVSISGWINRCNTNQQSFTFNAPSSARADAAVSHYPDTCSFGQLRSGGWPEGRYIIELTAVNASATAGATLPYQSILNVYGSQDGVSIENINYTGVGTWDVGAGNLSRNIGITTTKNYNYLFFQWSKVGPTSNYYVKITIDSIRITYANVVLTSKSISEPDGWMESKLILERHPEFHTLVEYFESSFIFYGNNGTDDGGIDFIKNIEANFGVDAAIEEVSEVTFDEASYDQVFDGLLDLSKLQETKDNKVEIPVIRESEWVKFISRRDTPVDLRSRVDLDGNPVDPVELVDINLTSQIVRQKFTAYQEQYATTSYSIPNNQYGGIDFYQEILSEINEKFTVPRVDQSTRPTYLFAVEFAGSYLFDIRIVTSDTTILSSATDARLQVKFQINDSTAITLSQSTEGTPGLDGHRVHTYSGLQTLGKGDVIRLYFFNNAIGSTYNFAWLANIFSESRLLITADTVYPSSSAQAFLLHDAFAGVIQRLVGRNAFYSEVLGGTQTNQRSYGSDGCHWANVILKGLHIRGYTLDEKPFFTSFNDLWKGSDPMFNLSLGYDVVDDEPVIRIESKSVPYDDSSASIQISNIREIIREYDNDRIFRSIKIGYNKWQSEDRSGIDDPQTKHTYATRFEKIGTDINLYSDFVAASLAIETTRRKAIEKNQDYKFDDDTFIIAINEDDVSPDRYKPELNENFNSVTGLIRPETRYNLVHTPLRMFLRWANYFTGPLQKYITSTFRFVGGEGNFDMVSDYNCSSGNECIAVLCDSLSEKQNIDLGLPNNYHTAIGFLHLPNLYTITIDMSWDDYKLIRENRNLSIEVSQTESNYVRVFIKKLEYELCHSRAKIIFWPATEVFALSLITSENPPPDRFGWRPVDPIPTPCSEVFYRAIFASTLDGWTNEGSSVITAPTLQSVSTWVNALTGYQTWDVTNTHHPFVDIAGGTPGRVSDFVIGTFAAVGGITYTFDYSFLLTGSLGLTDLTVIFALLDSSKNILGSTEVNFTSIGSKTGSISIISATDDAVYLGVRLRTNFDSATKGIQDLSVTSTNSDIPLPSWAWSSAFGGSAKALILYNGYGVYNLVKASASLPIQDTRIRIMYSVNNPDISLRLKIKDSGGSVLQSTVFATGITSSSEHTADIDITDLSIVTNANKLEILVESADFDVNDAVYITDFSVLGCTGLPDTPFDPDYQAILDRGTALGYSLPSSGQQIKQNELVLDLKAAGVWGDLDVLYVTATDGDSNFATINWVSPTTFQASKVNAPTFTTNQGFTGDGASSYLNTNWDPSTNAVHLTLNDASAICYINNNLAAAASVFAFGTHKAANAGRLELVPRFVGDTHVYGVNSAGTDSVGSSVSSKGFFHIRRTATNDLRLFKDGTQVGSTETFVASDSLSDKDLVILACNFNGVIGNYSLCQIGFFAAGASLSGKESSFYTAWNDYFTSL